MNIQDYSAMSQCVIVLISLFDVQQIVLIQKTPRNSK